MRLSNDDIERYIGQINLKKINIEGQKKIIQSKVLVIGVGGIGTPILTFLARSGVKHIGLVDYDIISKSNLHRQVLFDRKDIGKKKTLIAAKKIKNIDPKINVKAFNTKITIKNIKKIIEKYEYIVDGTDSFNTKLLINDECIKQKKKLFIGAVGQFQGHIFFFDFKRNSVCLRCFMPEAPQNNIKCQEEGILGSVTGTVGLILFNELIKEIVEIGSNLLNQILIIDFEKLSFKQIKINKSKKCKNYA